MPLHKFFKQRTKTSFLKAIILANFILHYSIILMKIHRLFSYHLLINPFYIMYKCHIISENKKLVKTCTQLFVRISSNLKLKQNFS